MATQQSLTIKASALATSTNNVKRWEVGSLAIDAALAPVGQLRSLLRLVARGVGFGPDGAQLLLLCNTGAQNEDLSSDWEMDSRAITFSQRGRSLILPGPNHPSNAVRDPSEIYMWSPPSAQAAAYRQFFFSDLDTSKDLTLTLSIFTDLERYAAAAAATVPAGIPTPAAEAYQEAVDLSGEPLVGVRYRIRDGDSLDAVCWRHYGRQAGAVEAVLEANPGLSEVGPILPAGLVIGLPELPSTSPEIETVSLWD